MSDIVIKAENIGKKYIIGHKTESGQLFGSARCFDAKGGNSVE